MTKRTIKTRAQVKSELARQGIATSELARKYGFNANLVYNILNDDDVSPRHKCRFGESHRIAVTLGLKDGVIAA
ncbi:DNA-binding protein [Brenneria populi subsp. brevivirga]|uniref:DNA-binding protein n=1 Tax=Brenneria alni TaxID=71656 RepID=A0A421DNP6_9GAMM|nr:MULTISPECIES: DNA-binding protein [Brenneria]MEC5319016.1 DNA-binding protein [Brenneria populi subsp. brevivirga]RLM23644.1 hypothetical protein BIY29_10095 [Brenneria alni]